MGVLQPFVPLGNSGTVPRGQTLLYTVKDTTSGEHPNNTGEKSGTMLVQTMLAFVPPPHRLHEWPNKQARKKLPKVRLFAEVCWIAALLE